MDMAKGSTAALAVLLTVFCGTGVAIAQDSGAFCGQAGPMLVSTEPVEVGIDTIRLVHAGGDQETWEMLKARGLDNIAVAPESDLAIFVTRFRNPAVISSSEIAHRALGSIGCENLVVVPFE